ncbi:glycosyltransferase involved in cell wall biosynthesis [Micromonospora sp. Llam0]|uniref:glycosyltransferase family 4 protein n=1 Tax=Micromonospora sp. Llam0 TaxID=2485143 RepID=UPI000F464795|nr:glycosyltransferase family 4 protein [Micromonospora sp. Llam0]ROO60633.1 glycosyltransferase involved in cell wall biosynthesis [Micromonospora sp. Llam0]
MADEIRILAQHLSGRKGGMLDIELIYEGMRSDGRVVAESYSTTALLGGGWDIVHLSWPEWTIRRDRGPVVAAADAARMLAVLRLAQARGSRIVWTAYNHWPHEWHQYRVADMYLQAFSMLADQVICNSQTLLDEFIRTYPAIRTADCRVIPQGHYRGVYPDTGATTEEARSRLGLPQDATVLLCLGVARRYKNLLPLLRSYREVAADHEDTVLLIAGEAIEAEFGRQLRREAAGLPGVRLDLHHISDEEIQYYFRAADRFVIPTSLPMSSASTMLALTFDCPVLGPHRGSFLELREILGSSWISTYEGGIRPQVLRDALTVSRPVGRPALGEEFGYSAIGEAHLRAFRELAGRS